MTEDAKITKPTERREQKCILVMGVRSIGIEFDRALEQFFGAGPIPTEIVFDMRERDMRLRQIRI